MERRHVAVVFDFGGVLITPLTTKVDEIAERHGRTMVELLEVMIGPRDVSTSDHPWHRAERGEIDLDEMIAGIVAYAASEGIELHHDELDFLLDGVFDVHHEVVERVGTLHADGYTTALLTNSFKEFRHVLEAAVDFSIFDEVIDSSEVGLRKPEPEIYELVTERLQCAPQQVVYLDDFHGNIVGGDDHGWTTIHVTNIHEALDQLDAVLGHTPGVARQRDDFGSAKD